MIAYPKLGYSEEVTSCWKNGPNEKTRELLDAAIQILNSVPYTVTIAYEKRLANEIEWADYKFQKPVVVLYFGDLDPAGEQIPESAFRHVRKWRKVPFEAYWCGLTQEQVDRYNVESDNGKFQWEALRHDAAVEIITSALNNFCRLEDISIAKQKEAEMTEKAREALLGII